MSLLLLFSNRWTPAQLSSVKSWVQGNELSGTNGSNVTGWTDGSGNSNSLTVIANPELQTSALNSLNVVRFINANLDRMDWPAAMLSAFTEGSVFFVTKSATAGGGSQGGPIDGFGTHGVPETYPYADGHVYNGFLSTTRFDTGAPSGLTSWHIGSFQSKASDWRYAINGTDFFTTTSNTVGAGTAPKIGSSGGFYYDGDIAEIIVFNSFLTTEERQRVEGYLAHKWALTAGLDAGHPYKASAPVISLAYSLAATPGAYALAGTATGLKAAWKLAAVPGAYALSGSSLLFVPARRLVAVPGAYSVTGTTTGLRAARRLVEAIGSYALTGTTTGLRKGYIQAEAVGSYSITGQATALRTTRRVVAVPGAYSLTGTALGLKTQRRLAGSVGSYALTGTATTLSYGAAAKVLTAAVGSYSLNGVSALTGAYRRLSGAVGSYSLAGTTAALVYGGGADVLTAVPGAYSLTGLAAALRFGRRLNTDSGSYAIYGTVAQLLYNTIWSPTDRDTSTFVSADPAEATWTVTAQPDPAFVEASVASGTWTTITPSAGTWN